LTLLNIIIIIIISSVAWSMELFGLLKGQEYKLMWLVIVFIY